MNLAYTVIENEHFKIFWFFFVPEKKRFKEFLPYMGMVAMSVM